VKKKAEAESGKRKGNPMASAFAAFASSLVFPFSRFRFHLSAFR
jgi:hypothetical protein